MTQYHNLDDSGDPGLSGSASSSSHFALAMVQLVENTPLSELADLRRALYFPPTFEFKYHNTTAMHKEVFFKAVRQVPYRVRVVVILKSGLDGRYKTMSGQDFIIEFITRLTLRASQLDIAGDMLIIDGAMPAFCRALRIRLSEECRKVGRVRPFNKIVGGRSKYEDGLQLADMIAGAVRHHVMGIGPDYYGLFKNKVVDLWQVTARGK